MEVHFIDFITIEENVKREAPGEVKPRMLTSSHIDQYIKWSLDLSNAFSDLSRFLF